MVYSPTLAAVTANLDVNSSDPLARLSAYASAKHMTTAQADAAAQDFESMFIAQMVEQMFGESEGEEAFGSKDTQDVYKSLMTEEYSKQINDAGGIGIASIVKQELLKHQEV